jgi:hypothetical protein
MGIDTWGRVKRAARPCWQMRSDTIGSIELFGLVSLARRVRLVLLARFSPAGAVLVVRPALFLLA